MIESRCTLSGPANTASGNSEVMARSAQDIAGRIAAGCGGVSPGNCAADAGFAGDAS